MATDKRRHAKRRDRCPENTGPARYRPAQRARKLDVMTPANG